MRATIQRSLHAKPLHYCCDYSCMAALMRHGTTDYGAPQHAQSTDIKLLNMQREPPRLHGRRGPGRHHDLEAAGPESAMSPTSRLQVRVGGHRGDGHKESAGLFTMTDRVRPPPSRRHRQCSRRRRTRKALHSTVAVVNMMVCDTVTVIAWPAPRKQRRRDGGATLSSATPPPKLP